MHNKIPIIYEDDDIMAVDKPAGVLAYPLPKSDEKTVGDIVGAMPVHRLDRDTFGVLLLAKNVKAKQIMQTIFAERKIKKTYLTLVHGALKPSQGEILIPLGRGSKDRLRVVPKQEGKESATVYNVLKYFANQDISFVSVDLKTGRTHQIRVHFSAIGHPVVGDQKYSNKKTSLTRQFLHAHQIEFIHPFNHKKVTIVSELPPELKAFLDGMD